MTPTNMPPVPPLPPLPRDAQAASMSEILPFRSHKISLWKSPVLWITACAGVISIFGFGMTESFLKEADPAKQLAIFQTMAAVSTFALLVMVTSGFYFYARPNKPYWVFAAGAVAVALLMNSPVWWLECVLTVGILPGNFDANPNLVTALFGPGLREETIKGIPALFGAWIAFRAMKNPALLAKGWVRNFRITGPLDGVVMGIAAGAGFTFIETGFEYVAKPVKFATDHNINIGVGEAGGMALIVPRVIEGLTGHSGYAAIFGYFIGLAVIRPGNKWRLLGIGWLTAIVLHALWDAFPGVLEFVWIAITGVIAIGALLKARQLEAVITGRAAETMGSIVVERPLPAVAGAGAGYMPPPPFAPPPQAFAPPPPFASPAPPFAPPPQAYAPPPPYPAPPVAQPTPVPPAPPPAAAPDGPLVIDIDGLKLPVRAGMALDLGAEPALGGRGAGVTGTIVPHPSRPGVFGLRNTGHLPWTAQLRDGTTQPIPTDKNIRLAPGVRIDFGGGLTGAVTPAG